LIFLGQRFKTAKVFSQTEVRVLKFKFFSRKYDPRKSQNIVVVVVYRHNYFRILSHEFALSSNFCRQRVYIIYLFHESRNCKMVYTGVNDPMNTNFFCGQVNREIWPTNCIHSNQMRYITGTWKIFDVILFYLFWKLINQNFIHNLHIKSVNNG